MKKLTDLALSILEDRYLWKDKNGRVIETPEQMFRRVAHFVASGEEKPENFKKYEEEFFNVMSNLDFLPNSPTLMNAGRPFPHGQLSACFVVDVPDSMEGICGALRKQMLIHKSGGGTGFNFSKLRAEGSQVNSTNGCASGPVSFMRLFDLSTDIVQQGGMRRGANMAVLNVDHPDIRKFIHCKDKDGDIKNFNLSVGLTDAFMEKATSPVTTPEYRLLMEIAESAWRTGDPGVVFLDTMERANPTPELGKLDATNPCGEQPLLPNEACNLGSINLVNMLKKDARGRYVIDFDKLKRTVHIAVRFLSDVIEVNQFPLPEIEEAVRKTRKIGLGVMGYAHMLYYLGIPYDSTVALGTLEQIMRTIKVAARCYTEQVLNDRPKHTALTCIAPTGTLSLIAGVSSGIEPVFALHHERTVLDHSGGSHTVTIYDSAYEDIVTNDLLSWLSPDEQENVYKTAYTVSPYWHIATQAVAQKYCDAGVSKTVNMPNTATVADIFEVYGHAWESGCKGTTVYRDGSKTSQVLKCPECVI